MSDNAASLAILLDDVRPLIDAARQRGADPRYVALGATDFQAINVSKQSDLERGMPLLLLGMEVVRADDPLSAPRVY